MRNEQKTIKMLNEGVEIMKQNDFDFHGYNVFVTPSIGRAMKGTLQLEKDQEATSIQSILINEEKRCVTVVFKDGRHEIIKCSKEDEFDPNIGVALAIAQHLFGSKNKFHKTVKRLSKTIEKKGKK